MPNKKGTKLVKLNLTVEPEFIVALEKAGFASPEHFFQHAIRALLEVPKDNKVDWPIRFSCYFVGQWNESAPKPMEQDVRQDQKSREA